MRSYNVKNESYEHQNGSADKDANATMQNRNRLREKTKTQDCLLYTSSHITMSEINQTINLHVSVDCVLIGFDGEQFRVLLVRQVGKQSEDGYNLSLIHI